MTNESNRGSEAYWWADGEVRELILEQGRIRVESTFATLTSLNSRLASLGGLLFAGAALTTTIATNVDKLSTVPTLVASVAVFFFAVGGLASFGGLASGRSAFAGEPPSWWAADGLAALRQKGTEDAKYWIAGHHEDVIASLTEAVRRRGIALNIALVFGAIGGVLVPVAAGTSMIYPKDVQTLQPVGLQVNITVATANHNAQPPQHVLRKSRRARTHAGS